MQRVRRKWRPPLALVIGGTLSAVVALPLLGIVYLRLWGDVLGWAEAAWLIAGLAVAAALALGFLLWRLVLRPIYALTGYARAMKTGQDATIPDHFGTPELSALGASVMAMGDSLDSRAAGLQAYADHVTHELKSPLTAIRGAAELLQEGAKGADAETLMQTVRDASARMQKLLDDLNHHARSATSAGFGTCVLSEVVSRVETPLDLKVAQDGVVPLAKDDLHTILTQLTRNAAEHGAGSVTLSASGRSLVVADDGHGISAGNRDRIFDPFFTTRREKGGTGMGLSIVRNLVQARGGTIALLPDDPAAAFCIEFD